MQRLEKIMNKKIALIGGTGPEGRGLAKRLSITDNEIFIGSRDEKKGKEIAQELKNELIHKYPNISINGGDNLKMARLAEIVIIVVPYSAHKATLEQIKDALKEKIVIDAVVPMEFQKGPRSIDVEEGSATEEAAAILIDSTVIGAFHNLSADTLLNLDKTVEGDVLITGNNKDAKKIVGELSEEISSVRSIDAGPLRYSKYVECLTVLLIGINKRYKSHSSLSITDINL
jgi:NADPH-dependent F420 reductase